MIRVPQSDPGAAYREAREGFDRVLARVMASGRYIQGDELASFERDYAAWHGVAHAVGVASGTDAVELALRAVGVGPGSSVITVSHTAVATVAAIERCAAKPVLVDVDEDSMTMSPAGLEEALKVARPGSPVGAIVPVHLYGHMAPMGEILELASRSGIPVVEDCAQAHGARYRDRIAGTMGNAGAFSFYPTKNLGAFGDGGAVITSDAEVAARLRRLREYGWRDRYIAAEPGVNSRLDELQAALLAARLPRLAADNERRRAIARHYDTAFRDLGRVVTPVTRDGCEHVYHQYVIRTDHRDILQQILRERYGIATAIHYPAAVHQQPAYAGRLESRDMRVTERVVPRLLSLPMFPELTDEQVNLVVRAAVRELHDLPSPALR